MKNFINSEILGASFVALTTIFVIFSCFYMKLNNINPRHAISNISIEII